MQHIYFQNYENGMPIPKPDGGLNMTPTTDKRANQKAKTLRGDEVLLELEAVDFVPVPPAAEGENDLLEI